MFSTYYVLFINCKQYNGKEEVEEQVVALVEAVATAAAAAAAAAAVAVAVADSVSNGEFDELLNKSVGKQNKKSFNPFAK